MFILNLVVLMR